MKNSLFSFIEAPIYQGQKNFGVSLGPSFLRQCLLDQNFLFAHLVCLSKQSSKKIVIDVYEELSYLVEREIRRKQTVFVAGGDHSLSIGSIQGALRYNPNLKVIWIDAHADINTQSSSITKAYHGMPLSFLTGQDKKMHDYEWFTENIKPENLIYVGLRDLDLAERNTLDRLNIQHYTTSQVHSEQRHNIFNQILQSIKNHQVVISLDADGFDPIIAPSTGVPVTEGLQFQIVEELVAMVARYSDVICYEYVELNPQIFQTTTDVFQTAQIGIDIFKVILKQKQKHQLEVYHGFNDRFSYSEESNLSDSYFGLEEQSRFTP